MNIRKRRWTWQGEKRVAWRLDWRDPAGRHQRQFRTKHEAELFRDKLIRERNAERYDAILGPITLKDFLRLYEAKKPWRTESYKTRVHSALTISPFMERRLTEITPAMIEAYRDERLGKQACAPATVRLDLAALSDCLTWAVKLKYLHANPAKDVERPSLPVKQDDPAAYLSPEEFGALVEKAGQDRPLYLFAVWTGLRITELLSLTWEDITDGYVLVRRGKGRKQRIVPLLPQAADALKQAARRLNDGRVFWWMHDRHTTLRRFQRRLAWAGITTRYRFHDLRHTFGSYAAQAGVDLEVIAAAMGHSSVTVTKLYAHLSPAYKRNELMKMAKLSPAGTREVQRPYNLLKTKRSQRA